MSKITKRALAQSLKKLLLQKPLTKITINDIAQDCGINRMTFYYHFKDIYDLAEWACVEDVRRALEDDRTFSTWQQGCLRILEIARENKPLIMNVYRCVPKEQLERYLKPLLDRLVLEIIGSEMGEKNVGEEDLAFIARAYSYLFMGLMLDWIRDDMRVPPQQIVEKLAVLLQGSMAGALERFAT